MLYIFSCLLFILITSSVSQRVTNVLTKQYKSVDVAEEALSIQYEETPGSNTNVKNNLLDFSEALVSATTRELVDACEQLFEELLKREKVFQDCGRKSPRYKRT